AIEVSNADPPGHKLPVVSMAFSPDGGRILSTSRDGTARIWDAATGRELTVLSNDTGVEAAVFSPDGALVVTTSSDGADARIWDAGTGAELAILQGKPRQESRTDFRFGRTLFLSKPFRQFTLQNPGEPSFTFEYPGSSGLTAVFSPDGTRIVTASHDRTTRFFDAASGIEIARIALEAEINALAVHGGSLRSAIDSDESMSSMPTSSLARRRHSRLDA